MEIAYYPNQKAVEEAVQSDDPLLIMIAHDGSKVLVANIDDVGEHIILLRKLGYPEDHLDRYFRLVVNSQGADWTFVCPSGYKGIKDKTKRIERFFRDGVDIIQKTLQEMGFAVEIHIPARYRRHLEFLG
ncbi:MAG: hypothetical protein K6U74_00450 [Firmicutes bacterium]|nr:hypothetical protein [Bacillota bacterium]